MTNESESMINEASLASVETLPTPAEEASVTASVSNDVTLKISRDDGIKYAGILFYLSIVFSVIYTLCMFKNMNGISFPFMALTSLLYIGFFLKKTGKKIKAGTAFCGASILLLAINMCITNDAFIIAINYIGIALLLITGLVDSVFDTGNFGFMNYLGRGMSVFFGSIPHIFTVIPNFVEYSKTYEKESKNSKVKYVLFGILIAVPLLIVVLLLLSSADIVFGDMLHNIFGDISIGNCIGIFFTMLASFLGSFALLARCNDTFSLVPGKKKDGLEPIIAITFNSVLAIVYLIFSVIQILYLFIGKMTLPKEYTYAQYARQGFFQLLAVCIMNLAIVLISTYLFRENTALKVILTIISLCTYIMIASSAMRMFMYIDVYLLTVLRVLVIWGLITLAILLAGICIYIYKHDFPLFKYMTVVVTVLYIGLAFMHPKYCVAEYNITRGYELAQASQNTDEQYVVDYKYIIGLGTDVAKAFENHQDIIPEEHVYRYLRQYGNKKTRGLRFNFSRDAFEKFYAKSYDHYVNIMNQ